MAFWGAIAAAVIASSAAIASESMKGGKGVPAGGGVGGEKKSFQVPDMFKNKSGSLMGGGSAQGPDFNLSKDLFQPSNTSPATPKFGPAGGGAFDDLERQRMLKTLMGGR